MTRDPECNRCECQSHCWAPATRWGVVLVDLKDAWLLANYGWHLVCGARRSSYAASHKFGGNGKETYLHKAVTNTDRSQSIDHKNGNGLDCRRLNLRKASHMENTRNKKAQKDGTSKFLGVSYLKPNRKYRTVTPKWSTQLAINGKNTSRGYFDLELDAAICYNVHAAWIYGDFARLNTISPTLYAHE